MVPAISKLHPPLEAHRHPALALKLNPEVLQQLRSLRQAHKKPKLVVKDGKFVRIYLLAAGFFGQICQIAAFFRIIAVLMRGLVRSEIAPPLVHY